MLPAGATTSLAQDRRAYLGREESKGLPTTTPAQVEVGTAARAQEVGKLEDLPAQSSCVLSSPNNPFLG